MLSEAALPMRECIDDPKTPRPAKCAGLRYRGFVQMKCSEHHRSCLKACCAVTCNAQVSNLSPPSLCADFVVPKVEHVAGVAFRMQSYGASSVTFVLTACVADLHVALTHC